MPDHVHMLFRILENQRLGDILRTIKGRSARQINQLLSRNRPLWIVESFDHVIRYEVEYKQKIEYIIQNPVTKRLVREPNEYEWLMLKT